MWKISNHGYAFILQQGHARLVETWDYNLFIDYNVHILLTIVHYDVHQGNGQKFQIEEWKNLYEAVGGI